MSDRDRRAEQIRTVLRRAGFDDLDEGHLYGFAVEGGDDGDRPGVFLVAVTQPDRGQARPTLTDRYRDALTAAGYQIAADPTDPDGVLEVTAPAGPATAAGDLDPPAARRYPPDMTPTMWVGLLLILAATSVALVLIYTDRFRGWIPLPMLIGAGLGAGIMETGRRRRLRG